MKESISFIPVFLYFVVGMISLVMAFKCLFSNKLLPFHEKAAGKPWNEIENSLKPVIISMLRISGLGFLIISILLIVFPVVNYVHQNEFCKYSVPGLALLYCTGLFVINYSLYKSTKAETPWKGSLYAMVAIIAGIIVSIFNYV
jgi:hypothetical protein